YGFQGCAVDNKGASQCRARTVTVNAPSCPAPTIGPISATPNSFTMTIAASVNATDSGRVHFSANYLGVTCGYRNVPDPAADTDVTGSGPTYSATLATSMFSGCYEVHAVAFSSCSTATATAAPVNVNLFATFVPPGSLSRGTTPWSSDLGIDGGRMQVVLNGASTTFPGSGRAYGLAPLVEGENRVEAVLVESGGKAGLWRFEFMNAQSVVPGSIHVIAGDVVTVASSSVTFRLRGESGERIVFTFQKQ